MAIILPKRVSFFIFLVPNVAWVPIYPNISKHGQHDRLHNILFGFQQLQHTYTMPHFIFWIAIRKRYVTLCKNKSTNLRCYLTIRQYMSNIFRPSLTNWTKGRVDIYTFIRKIRSRGREDDLKITSKKKYIFS